MDETFVPQFSSLSETITKDLDKKHKRKNGIFFTPYNIIKKTSDIVFEYCKNNDIIVENILEPSCGSCEFIRYIHDKYSMKNIDGIEYDDNIYESIKNINFTSKNNINLIHMDYLTYDNDRKYDLIIGNPPYFVMKKDRVDKKYHDYFDGRPNIFIIFIIHSLFKLKDNGILSFVLPKSFCNCLYYNKLRVYININYTIVDIIDCSKEKYLETEQDTVILILHNKKGDNSDYIYDNNGIILMNTIININKIESLYENSTTLKKIKFNVRVGNIVWNQCKDILTDDEKYTRLIYSSDIVEHNLSITKYKNIQKKNYIKSDGIKNPIIVVNRGYGTGKYNFSYCIVDIDEEYLIENHLIIIEYKDKSDVDKLLKEYDKIKKSFENEKTKQFIELYCCNSAMNCTELHTVLPIYV